MYNLDLIRKFLNESDRSEREIQQVVPFMLSDRNAGPPNGIYKWNKTILSETLEESRSAGFDRAKNLSIRKWNCAKPVLI